MTSPILLVDGYKVGHIFQYPKDTTLIYSNFTPRRGIDPDSQGVVFFGLQRFIEKVLIREFETWFAEDTEEAVHEYRWTMEQYLGGSGVGDCKHIRELHKLGCLPVRIKALPEGTVVPYGVPVLTIENTLPDFYWVTNMLETVMSAELWKACTSATTALRFRRNFERYSKITVTDGHNPFIDWQGHDFSMRGMSGAEDAAVSGAGHLLSFMGTDTLPAIELIRDYYDDALAQETNIGGSIPATEHSVMSMGLEANERDTFVRLITEVYPSGPVSIVSDTWDFWHVLCVILPSIKDIILARDGKVVIRPDSGDPVDIVVGDARARKGEPEHKGAIQVLDETFGHTLTAKGFKTLNPKVGLIYGDGITLERQNRILEGLHDKGYSSDNIVLGVGSYTYQYTTRDVHGFAMKATYGETLSGGPQVIYKKPKTDHFGKNSARGLLRVDRVDGKLVLREDVTREQEQGGELRRVFEDGEAYGTATLSEIRARLRTQVTP